MNIYTQDKINTKIYRTNWQVEQLQKATTPYMSVLDIYVSIDWDVKKQHSQQQPQFFPGMCRFGFPTDEQSGEERRSWETNVVRHQTRPIIFPSAVASTPVFTSLCHNLIRQVLTWTYCKNVYSTFNLWYNCVDHNGPEKAVTKLSVSDRKLCLSCRSSVLQQDITFVSFKLFSSYFI